MACNISGLSPLATATGNRSRGGCVGSTPGLASAAPLISRQRNRNLDTDPPRMSTQGIEFQADTGLARPRLTNLIIQSVPVQLPAAGLYSLQVVEQVEITTFQLQLQPMPIERHRCRVRRCVRRRWRSSGFGGRQLHRLSETAHAQYTQLRLLAQQLLQHRLHFLWSDQLGGVLINLLD